MGRLIYAAIASLDGYVADAEGNFDWAAPDEETHALVNDLLRPVGTHLYGRRMYDVLVYWEDAALLHDEEAVIRDFAAIWQAADKVVYSRTLAKPTSARTRITREFDADEVRRLKESATRDISIAGPEVAALAFRAGLVDECHLFLVPVLVGGGNRALAEGVHAQLTLREARSVGTGVAYLRYDVRTPDR